jgi:hypothetical protein
VTRGRVVATRVNQKSMVCDEGRSMTLTAAARKARGKFPTEVRDEHRDGNFRSESTQYHSPDYEPELHPLDAEWYFTPRTSKELARLLRSGSVCLLGTPTVAACMHGYNFVLVDSSPHILPRFPTIPPDLLVKSRVEVWRPGSRYDTVVLDPPWYSPDMESWLQVAGSALVSGGTLFLPLLGEGTRPTAPAERAEVLRVLGGFGDVDVLQDAVEYDIPLFEERALSAAGIGLSEPWRRADLAIVRGAQTDGHEALICSTPRAISLGAWETSRFGAQVVKTRISEPSKGDLASGLLAPVTNTQDFRLDSVSRRDARLAEIDVWTSRNRVAKTNCMSRLRMALEMVSTADDWEFATAILAAEGFSVEDVKDLATLLEVGIE